MKVYANSLSILLAIVFFIFLFFPILNPRIAKTSLYFFYLVPFIDPNFLKYIKFEVQKFLLIVLGFMIAVLAFDLFLIIKIFFLSTGLIYFRYLNSLRLDGLVYYFFIFSVSIALVQMLSLIFVGSMWLSPEAISKSLYGDYAIQLGDYKSRINYLGLGYRVSGWSTEPAFFSSLSFMAFLYCIKILKRNSILIYITFLIACFLSFSRITALLLLLLLIVFIIDYLKLRVNLLLMACVYPIALAITFNFIYDTFGPFFLGGSGVHRTIGYYILSRLSELDVQHILFGLGNYGIYEYANTIKEIQFSPMFAERKGNILDNSGISEIILQYGLLGYGVLVLFLYKIKLSGEKFLLLLLATINVSIITSSSFVLLAWAIVLQRVTSSSSATRHNRL